MVHISREEFDVFIGRPSKWGNPFVIGRDGTRARVIERYREWLAGQPELLAALPELRGKVLGCFCAPLACHGDVLAALANACEMCESEAEERRVVGLDHRNCLGGDECPDCGASWLEALTSGSESASVPGAVRVRDVDGGPPQ